MPRLGDLDLAHHLADPALKAQFVTPMFDLVASRYDDFTRVFSFGMDRSWKRELVTQALQQLATSAPLRDAASGRALDLACGTGDLAFAVATTCVGALVTGIDGSRAMIALACGRTPRATCVGARVDFSVGDLGALPVADGSVDLITAGYAFRNGPPLGVALREVARTLRPGGVLGVLDFYRPTNTVWRALFLAYLRAAGSAVGWWWHREPVAYGYIAPSIAAYVSADAFSKALIAAGLQPTLTQRFLAGGVAIHVAVRRG